MRKHLIFISVTLIVLTAIAGCGLHSVQRTAIDDFAASTSAVGKITSDEVLSMRNETINMNRNTLILAGPDQNLPRLVDLDGTFKPNITLAMVKAVNALKTYGESLESFSKATQQDELQKAAGNLSTSLNGLPEKYKLTADEQGAIGKIITAGGNMIVGEMKEHYIKNIVPTCKEPLNRLANLMINDFDENYPGSIAQVFLAYSVRSSTYASRVFDQCKEMSCREKAITSFEGANANVVRTETVYPEIRKSLKEMIKAHEALAAALESNKLSQADVKDFSKSIKNLADAIKVFAK